MREEWNAEESPLEWWRRWESYGDNVGAPGTNCSWSDSYGVWEEADDDCPPLLSWISLLSRDLLLTLLLAVSCVPGDSI